MNTSTESAQAPQEDRWRGPLTKGQTLAVVFGVILTVLLSALDQTIITIAALPIASDLDSTDGIELMPWLITAYMLTSTATQPLYGKIADIVGAKKVYLAATAIFVVGSALCGVAQDMTQLIVFRALQGIGAGGLYGISMVILAVIASPKDRAKYQGLATLVIAVVTVIGPLIGGFLTTHHAILGVSTSWRWIFYVNLPLGLVALVLIMAKMRLPVVRQGHSLDIVGALLIMAGACGVLLVTSWGGARYSWSSPTIVWLSVASVALLAAFIWRQAKAAEPIIPLRLFTNTVARIAFPILFLVGASLMGALVYLALYLQIVRGYTPTSAGVHMLPLVVGMMITAIAASAIIEARGGRYKICPVLGTALSAVGLGILAFLKPDTSYLVLATGAFLVGAGLGLLMQIVLLAVQNAVPAKDLNVATTSATFFRPMGQSVGVAVFGAILTNSLASRLAGSSLTKADVDIVTLQPDKLGTLPPGARDTVLSAFTGSVDVIFVVAALVMTAAFVLSLFLKEMRLRDIDDAEVMESAAVAVTVREPVAAGADQHDD